MIEVTVTDRDCADLESLPKFRRSTLAMRLATRALQKISHEKPIADTTGIVLCTGLGELPATLQFLGGVLGEGSASPILFQNSLHNSTLGFLTMEFRLYGPGICVCSSTGPEEALNLATSLVQSKKCPACLVVHVDTHWPLHPFRVNPQDVLKGQAKAWFIQTE